LLYSAITLIESANQIVGGRYILVDAFNCKPVIHFYERNGFTKLATIDENSTSKGGLIENLLYFQNKNNKVSNGKSK